LRSLKKQTLIFLTASKSVNQIEATCKLSISKETTMSSAIYDEVVSANDAYAASFGDKAWLALPPARRFAILTCMDARLDPAKYAGLSEGDAHVIRNAGGRASDDAICSLVISHKLLGTREWVRDSPYRLRDATLHQ
jgi:carbonic anhydrase